jgi:hypothetical protein
VGRADAVKTETVVAVVVAGPAPAPVDKSTPAPTPEQDQAQLADQLRALCREHLAPYEVPQQFEFRTELPRSALGKLLKRELRNAPPAPAPSKGHVNRIEGLTPDSGRASSNGNGKAHATGNGSVNGNGSQKQTEKQPEAK